MPLVNPRSTGCDGWVLGWVRLVCVARGRECEWRAYPTAHGMRRVLLLLPPTSLANINPGPIPHDLAVSMSTCMGSTAGLQG